MGGVKGGKHAWAVGGPRSISQLTLQACEGECDGERVTGHGADELEEQGAQELLQVGWHSRGGVAR